MTLPPHIGVPTDAWGHRSLPKALDRAARLAGLVEISSWGREHSLLKKGNLAAARASGLRFTVHGPFLEIDPGSLDERVRREAVDTHRRHLEAAAEAGALRYVFHPDYSVAPVARDPRVVAAVERTIADLAEVQRDTGVTIVVENMPGRDHSTFVAPGELDLGDLSFCLDAGHAAISGTLDAFLDHPGLPLAHVHLHDNLGPADDDDPHRPLGQGVVDAAAVLRAAAAANATVILELMSERDVRESIAYLRAASLLD